MTRETWEKASETLEFTMACVFDPYIEALTGPAGPRRRVYVRDRWRFLQFDGFQPGPHEWLLQPIGGGGERIYRSSREPIRWTDHLAGRVGYGTVGTKGVRAPHWASMVDEATVGDADPYEPSLLGSVLALRQYLAEEQRASIERASRQDPILARYEIVDARSLDVPAVDPFAGEGFARNAVNGYVITAYLYWVTTKRESLGGPTDTIITRQTDEETGAVRISVVGPRLHQLRLDTVEYQVAPSKTGQPQQEDEVQYVIQSGWTVREPGKPIASSTFGIPERNSVLAICDPSTHPR
jgi:hypothetical protein